MKKKQGYVYLMGVAVLLYMVNYALVQAGFAPVLYCAGSHAFAPLRGWWELATLLVLVWFVYYVWKGGLWAAIWGTFPVVAVFALPLYAEIVFGLGAAHRCS